MLIRCVSAVFCPALAKCRPRGQLRPITHDSLTDRQMSPWQLNPLVSEQAFRHDGLLLSAIGYKNKAAPLIERLPLQYVVTIFLLEVRVTIPSAPLRDTSRFRTLCEWVPIRHLSRPPLQFRSAGRHNCFLPYTKRQSDLWRSSYISIPFFMWAYLLTKNLKTFSHSHIL